MNRSSLLFAARGFFLSAAALALSGCSAETQTIDPSVSAGSPAAPIVRQIDAGIILSGRDNHVCFPADAVGIANDSRIERVDASCECVRITPIRTVVDAASSSLAFDLFFPADPESSGRHSLRIECEAIDDDGEASRFAILCVCTTMAEETDAR